MVEVPGERVRHRLRFLVVVEAGEIAPAAIAAHLDEPGAELEAEEEPAEEPHERRRYRARRRTKEGGEKPRFEEERLPAECVEGLPHVDDREIERPEQEPDRHGDRRRQPVRNSGEYRQRKHDPGDGDRDQQAIRITEVEEARRPPEAHASEESWDREETVLAEERAELLEHHHEGDEVDDAEPALEEETSEPVAFGVEPMRHRTLELVTSLRDRHLFRPRGARSAGGRENRSAHRGTPTPWQVRAGLPGGRTTTRPASRRTAARCAAGCPPPRPRRPETPAEGRSRPLPAAPRGGRSNRRRGRERSGPPIASRAERRRTAPNHDCRSPPSIGACPGERGTSARRTGASRSRSGAAPRETSRKGARTSLAGRRRILPRRGSRGDSSLRPRPARAGTARGTRASAARRWWRRGHGTPRSARGPTAAPRARERFRQRRAGRRRGAPPVRGASRPRC